MVLHHSGGPSNRSNCILSDHFWRQINCKTGKPIPSTDIKMQPICLKTRFGVAHQDQFSQTNYLSYENKINTVPKMQTGQQNTVPGLTDGPKTINETSSSCEQKVLSNGIAGHNYVQCVLYKIYVLCCKCQFVTLCISVHLYVLFYFSRLSAK